MIAAITAHLSSWGVPHTVLGERIRITGPAHMSGEYVDVTASPLGDVALTSGGILTSDPMVAAATVASPIARSLYIHLHDADH